MPSGDCAPHFQVIWYHSVLSPPESRGAELSGSPELGGRRQRRKGRWGDPAGGEAPTSPSFLVPAVAAATAQFCEELAGDSETVSGTAAYGSRGSGVHGSWGKGALLSRPDIPGKASSPLELVGLLLW